MRIPVGRPEIILLPVNAGAPIPIDAGSLQPVERNFPSVTWLPDSERILISGRAPGRPARTFVRSIGGGELQPITPEGLWGSILSPDGALLLVYDSPSNAFVFPISGGTPKPLPFLTSGHKALTFSADGRAIFVTKLRERPPTVWRIDLATGHQERWREIPLGDPTVTVWPASIQITPDGKSIAYSFRTNLSELYLVHGLR